MWALAAFFFVGLCARALVHGGPALWVALVVGAVVLGGDPDHPLAALLGGGATYACLSLLLGEIADRLSGR